MVNNRAACLDSPIIILVPHDISKMFDEKVKNLYIF